MTEILIGITIYLFIGSAMIGILDETNGRSTIVTHEVLLWTFFWPIFINAAIFVGLTFLTKKVLKHG